jgi:hypothetical protein
MRSRGFSGSRPFLLLSGSRVWGLGFDVNLYEEPQLLRQRHIWSKLILHVGQEQLKKLLSVLLEQDSFRVGQEQLKKLLSDVLEQDSFRVGQEKLKKLLSVLLEQDSFRAIGLCNS